MPALSALVLAALPLQQTAPLGATREAARKCYDVGGPQLVVMNPPGTSYADPEIHPTRPEMVYQASDGIWTGRLDPDTGLFRSADGRDAFVDVASSLLLSKNGPEYGLDANGWAIFYNKTAPGNVVQLWRATPNGGGFDTTPLSGIDLSRINPLVSQAPSSPTTFVLYARVGAQVGIGHIAYLDEAAPAQETLITPLLPSFAGFRWARDTTTYASTESAGIFAGQILVGDAALGTQSVVTEGDGIKFDPFPWRAPEFGGALAVLAIENGGDIGVYRDVGAGLYVQHALLTPPAETSMLYAQSPEPFVAGGRSYISLTLKNDPGSIFSDVTESEIWVYGIDDGPERYTKRCDDGGPGRVRHEAETWSGSCETFLYYNELLPTGGFDVVRVRTGLAP